MKQGVVRELGLPGRHCSTGDEGPGYGTVGDAIF